MKNISLLSLVLTFTFFTACSEQAPTKDAAATEAPLVEKAIKINYDKYPQDLQAIFKAHGGLELWKQMNLMSFTMPKETGDEVHTIQLKDRRETIKGHNFHTGYDGQKQWLKADTSYQGNPIFYRNLMFYFYAMPFVLADDGIIYSKADDLVFQDTTYSGIRISYQDGVGVSSKDEYLLYFDPNNHQMAWLAYTVTYFSQEKADDLHWIRYNDWKEVDGLLLPNTLSWYQSENNQPTSLRSTRSFTNIKVSKEAVADELFMAVEGAEMIEE